MAPGVTALTQMTGAYLLAAQRLTLAQEGTHPETAKGLAFLTFEDETGLLNVGVHPGSWREQGKILRENKVVLVKGIVEKANNVINLTAALITPIATDETKITPKSRDFH